MRILLDTQAFLWLIADAPALSRRARALFAKPGNEFLLSLASLWEMAIKLSLGKLRLDEPMATFIPRQMQENAIVHLGIEFRHVVGVAGLPFHHRDPFDRLLAAQALVEGLPILSPDRAFDAYHIKRLW